MLTWLLVGLVGLGLVGAGAFGYLYLTIDIPDPNEDFQTQTSFVYYSGGEREVGRFATQNRVALDLEEMPQELRDAVVAAENRTFWTDRGIDPRGILRAAFNNARGGPTQGASTITQQYVKLLYLTQERSLDRKVREAILSLKVHRRETKEQILQGYLNTIYFGRGAYGVQAAAEAFFDIEAARLNLRQSAALASILNNPSQLDPANGRENRILLKERFDYTLAGMADMGTISQADATAAQRRLPRFPKIRESSQYGGQRGHQLRLVREELVQLGFSDEQINGGGLRVTTTFTPQAMEAARDGVLAQRPEGFGDRQLHVAVASVEPGTGALRGFFGGQDYLDSEINWAVAGGMAGSTFKAFALAAAIEDGYSLEDTFDGNSPYLLPDGSGEVENQGNSSYGAAISMLAATESSVNTAFVDMTLGMEDGPRKVIDAARALGVPGNRPARFGIPRASVDVEPTAGVALGTAQVSPINMASAYATIANGGERAPVHVIERVEDASGAELYRYRANPQRVLEEDIAADVSYALQQVVQSGSGTAALSLGRPAAGKTGTATNGLGQVSSSWFVGYTPQLATAVMYVRGEGRGQLDGWLPEYFGGSYPARTWTDVMTRLMEGLPVEEFPEPAFVDGDAPQEGHGPTIAPPPEPAPAPTREPEAPEPSREPTPSEPPSPPPSSPPASPPSSPPGSPTPPGPPDPDDNRQDPDQDLGGNLGAAPALASSRRG